MTLDQLGDTVLEFPAFFTGLTKTRRQYQHHLDAVFTAGFHDGRNGCSRRGDHGQVYRFTDIGQGRIGFLSLDLFVFRVNGVNLALETRSQQVSKDHASNRIFTVAGSKKSYFPGGE